MVAPSSTPAAQQQQQQQNNGTTRQRHPLLNRPLYAFDLPAALLPHLAICKDLSPLDDASSTNTAHDTSTAPTASSSSNSTTSSSATSCQICPGAGSFGSTAAQRAHFRSEWHQLNLQLNRGGHADKIMPEAQFDKACEGELCASHLAIVSSIVAELVEAHTPSPTTESRPTDLDTASSAGATDDEKSSSAVAAAAAARATKDVDQVARILEHLQVRTARRSSGGPEGSAAAGSRGNSSSDESDGDGQAARAKGPGSSESPYIWLETPASAPADLQLHSTQLGAHRALFPDLAFASSSSSTPSAYVLSTLRDLQSAPLRRKPDPRTGWTGKRLKSGKAADAGKAMQMSILDGEGFIPGLQLKREDMEEQDEEDDESSDAFSEDDAEESTALQDHSSSRLSTASNSDPAPRLWTILLMGGGHFAIAVLALNPHVRTTRTKKAGEVEERGLLVLAHRTFHRYTTRRKQGGSQSAQDATGRFAKSAGAQLRRYGEESLRQDIRAVLDLPGWRTLIERSERVWMRAGARAAKGVLYNWDGRTPSPLDALRKDGRLATLPIQAGRATLAEILRCFFELARVRLAHHSPEDFAALRAERDEAALRSRRKADQRRAVLAARQAKQAEQAAASAAARAKDQLTPQEKALRQRIERLVEMVQRGRVEALTHYVEKYRFDVLEPQDINGALPAWWRAQHSDDKGSLVPTTLLQLAAEAGEADMVQYLLVELRADPTIAVLAIRAQDVGEAGAAAAAPAHRTAYDLASNKAARDVFRRMMAEQPDWWNWGGMEAGGARVPSALTTAMEDAKAAKVKDRRAAMREKARARVAKEQSDAGDSAASEPAEEPTPAPAQPAPSHATRNRLGGNIASSPTLKALMEDTNLTPEMRMRIEREKRARAAEERFKKLQQQ